MKMSRFNQYRLTTLVLLLIAAGCSLGRPETLHLAWTFDRNLITLPAVAGGQAGTFVFGSAHPTSVFDQQFTAESGRRGVSVVLGDRYQAVTKPVAMELEELADGILGIDIWRDRSVTVDYRRGLLILGRELEPIHEGIHHRYETIPAVPVRIDGREELAVVDTANPDTILLPSSRWGDPRRMPIELTIGEVSLGSVDASVAPVSEIRLGNRVLSRFLVTFDYPRREVTLWPDAR